MKKILVTTLIACLLIPSAFAALTTTYNATIPYINGAGNPNTGWVSGVNDVTPNLKLGIRADSFTDGSTPNNGAGTYTFASGLVNAGTRATWNYQFTANSDTSSHNIPLNTYEYWLTLSINGGPASAPFDLLSLGDNTYGDNTSTQGFNVSKGGSALAATHNVFANSENIIFLGDLNTGGTYQFEFYATLAGSGSGGAKLDDVNMTVNVVPEPSTYVAGALLLLPFGVSAVRKLRKNRVA